MNNFYMDLHHYEAARPPPFDEEETRQLLSKLASRMWAPSGAQPVVLRYQEIEEVLRLGSELETFLDFCQKMNFLIYTTNIGLQFKDSNLRDYCAASEFIKLLDRDHMDMPGVRSRAVEALVQIGSFAIPALLKALCQKQSEVNLGAVVALRDIGTSAIPSLSKALHHPSPHIRKLATSAL